MPACTDNAKCNHATFAAQPENNQGFSLFDTARSFDKVSNKERMMTFARMLKCVCFCGNDGAVTKPLYGTKMFA